MSGIYISEVSMPNGEGSKLVLQVFPNGEVYDAHGIRLGIDNWSEAVPVPDHGRLIDADADPSEYVTIWDCECSEFGRQTVMAVDDLMYLPTILPASGGKEHE